MIFTEKTREEGKGLKYERERCRRDMLIEGGRERERKTVKVGGRER
jgi:hypothetical protein